VWVLLEMNWVFSKRAGGGSPRVRAWESAKVVTFSVSRLPYTKHGMVRRLMILLEMNYGQCQVAHGYMQGRKWQSEF
jgi:hypothetical protein